MEVIREIRKQTADSDQSVVDVSLLSVIDVDQFYGIEINQFSVRIAETALWMMDHLMNNLLSLQFGKTYARLPFKTATHIMHADALKLDWSELLKPGNCSFVLGNPPFVGAKFQTALQLEQVREIAALGKNGGTLDYVAAWFIQAGEYLEGGNARIGFVATNSITQGEHVAQLWPILFERCRLALAFAHRAFAWGSDARGKAHVHVVILGLERRTAVRENKTLFSYPDINGAPVASQHKVLSPYLFDADNLTDPTLVVQEESSPINGMGRLIIGSKPIDGGIFIFSSEEYGEFIEEEPLSKPYFRPFVGVREFLHGNWRWILALHDASPEELAQMPSVRKRISEVRNIERQAKVCRRKVLQQCRHSIMSMLFQLSPSWSFQKPVRSGVTMRLSVGWSRLPFQEML